MKRANNFSVLTYGQKDIFYYMKNNFFLILLYTFLNFTVFSQNNSFYFGTGVNNTFCKVTKNDNVNKTRALIGPGFNLAIGYSQQLNNKFLLDFSLNFLLRQFMFTFDNNNARSQYGTINPVPNLKISYLHPLNSKNTLLFSASYNQLISRNEGFSSSRGINLNSKDTNYIETTNYKGFANCFGLGIGNIHKYRKRFCYFGISYYQGLTPYSKTQIEIYKNNTTYFSELVSRLSYLSVDFKIYFKKHKQDNDND